MEAHLQILGKRKTLCGVGKRDRGRCGIAYAAPGGEVYALRVGTGQVLG